MTNVLMVTKHFYPSIGGVERYVGEVSQRLVERNYTVQILAPSHRYEYSNERMGRIDVVRLPVYSYKRLDISPRMWSFIKRNRFDIVHFHTFETLCHTLRAAMGSSKPYFITTHGLTWSKPKGLMETAAKVLGGTILKGNFVNARKIFCVSKTDCMSVERIVGNAMKAREKMIYLPVGVDAGRFSVSRKEVFKEEHNCGGKIVITQISRFTAKKGQHVLLNAISKIKNEIPENCVFVLAGYVQSRKYLMMLQQKAAATGLGGRISFCANVTDKDLLDTYGITDVFVLPSLAEGFPLSILEAWASKCSVIASSVGGIPYVARHMQDAVLVPPNNSEMLSRQILNLVKDEPLRRQLSSEGYRRVVKEFSWNNVVDAVSREYDTALRT